MSSDDALCLNLSDSEYKEMLAIIDNNFEVRMTFDESRRPLSLTLEGAEFHTEYSDNSFDLIYTIDGISSIENIPTKSHTKATGEEAFDFAIEITKSEIFDKVVDKVDDKLEEKYGQSNILGNFLKFADMVNTLRALDNIDNALQLVEYLESSNDIIKLIDLIKTKPTHQQDDNISYAIGLIVGGSEVDGDTATLILDGIIKGASKGREFNFEYGLCYSSSNNIPVYSDGNIGKTYTGLLLNPINITLPTKLKTPSLDKGKYHYRGYFKDNESGDIVYSNDIGEFEIKEDRWVDLGLPSGILWAKYNVGATSPEEYGGYYAWGETEEKSSYYWDNYQYYEKYLLSCISGTSYDVATQKWGDGARMPKCSELDELCENCSWLISTYNGVTGMLIIGQNDKSIFLPFAGYGRNTQLYYDDTDACYWSSTREDAYGAEALHTNSNKKITTVFNRLYGLPVRPVKDKN